MHILNVPDTAYRNIVYDQKLWSPDKSLVISFIQNFILLFSNQELWYFFLFFIFRCVFDKTNRVTQQTLIPNEIFSMTFLLLRSNRICKKKLFLLSFVRNSCSMTIIEFIFFFGELAKSEQHTKSSSIFYEHIGIFFQKITIIIIRWRH